VFCSITFEQSTQPETTETMSTPDIEKKKHVVDPEGTRQHIETYNYIDEEELKGIQSDVNIGVVALQGQDLHFTEEGKFDDNQSCLRLGSDLLEKCEVLRKIDWHIVLLAAYPLPFNTTHEATSCCGIKHCGCCRSRHAKD
jgi:hypothetical protein